jgi:D-methionine transport system substrate-binding protein
MLNKFAFRLGLSAASAGRLTALAALMASVSAYAAEPLRVAADPVPHAEILDYVKKIDPGLNLKVIEIPEGVNSNELLEHGDVDANYFQHRPYLLTQEKALGVKFAVAAEVHIEPLGIYSSKYKHYDQVPDNAKVAIPNNETNLSRGLYLLQDQGLIKLKPELKTLATPQDLISGNYALEAGLDPAKDALGLEKAQGNPYANIVVTTQKLAQDPRILRLAKDLESPQVAEFIIQKYHGSVLPVSAAKS